MTKEKAINYLQAIRDTFFQYTTPTNSVVAINMAIEAIENQEILLELLSEVDYTDYVCRKLNFGDFCEKNCGNGCEKDCYLEYCRIKKEEKNERTGTF